MTYGYCRISTKQQSIERQIRNISAAFPDAKIYQEAYTGTKIERPEFEKLLKRLKEGDTVVFDSVSRMSRNAEDGWELYQSLFNKGIDLVFLKEHHIDTDVYRAAQSGSIATVGNEIADLYIEATNKVLMLLAQNQVKIAFDQAQKEVDDLHERTKEGIQTARLDGKQIGQRQGAKLNVKKAAAAKEVIRKHSKDFGGTLDDVECMQLAKCSRNSFYKYKRELREEN
jgi:DNA invertase Pin-like site-specific DNA recombinase